MTSFPLRISLVTGLAALLQAQNVAVPVMSPLSVKPGEARVHSQILFADPAAVLHGPGQPSCTSTNGCYYFPADLNIAYATGSIRNGNGGAGMTVGIVDAYYNPQTIADLATFNAQFGLPPADITIVGQTGLPPTAGFNSGWATETNLDVQWVHSIAPNAKILLVTGNSNSFADLGVAVTYARQHSDVVSNSYGNTEFSGETAFDSSYSPSVVPILFSSGDTGAVSEYPCTSSYVTCVGGTNLVETVTSFRNTESAWSGSGGGCSSQIPVPTYQLGISTGLCPTTRGAPDVSAIADPNSGVVVYFGSNITATPGFYLVGGTSLACPVLSAVVALVDSARVAAGKAKLGSNLNQLIYQAAAPPATYHYRFFDVISGTSGYSALPGWDKATGLGVPLGPALTSYLVGLP